MRRLLLYGALLSCSSTTIGGGAVATDAGSEGGAPDGGGTNGGDGGDGGASDGSATDGAVTDARLCEGRDASICDDFDDMSLSGQWSTSLQPSGQIVFDGGGRSQPNAVIFTADGGDNAARARIHQQIAGGTVLTCNFDLYYDSKGAAGFEIARIDVSGSAQTMTVVLLSESIKTIAGAGSKETAFTGLPKNTWATHTLVVDLGSGTASIVWSGAPKSNVQLVGFPAPQLFDVGFGLQYLPSGQTTFRVDDVVCTVQ